MNGEYQRLEAEGSEVQNQIDEVVRCCGQMVAADFQKFEAKIAGLQQSLAGLRQAMGRRIVLKTRAWRSIKFYYRRDTRM